MLARQRSQAIHQQLELRTRLPLISSLSARRQTLVRPSTPILRAVIWISCTAFVADAALGLVDDALERQISSSGLIDDAKVKRARRLRISLPLISAGRRPR